MIRVRLINADVLAGLDRLPDESVQCCVTSIPYYNLRDYGVEGQIGLESTLDEYLEKITEVFRAVKRVLRKDGTLWLNCGDSYVANRGNTAEKPGYDNKSAHGGAGLAICKHRKDVGVLKPKDLMGVPWRIALNLQADGWYLRSDIIWAKPNPMPESCTDRPTNAHEYIFLLTKSAKYFYDHEAVRENFADNRMGNPGAYKWSYANNPDTNKGIRGNGGPSTKLQNEGWNADGNKTGRNLRSVWTIATHPLKEAHFATFPPAIPERCIKAGTSERGCCPKCGAGWRRVVEKNFVPQGDVSLEKGIKGAGNQKPMDASSGWDGVPRGSTHFTTTGWSPTCTCDDSGPLLVEASISGAELFDKMEERFLAKRPLEPIPCTVLDPFSGAGTTAIVAAKMGRDAIGIELNPAYVEMSRKRIAHKLGFLAEITLDIPGESR